MALLDRLVGLAAKAEATAGVDPTVAEATDSILTRNLEVNPFDVELINRNLDRATLGGEGDIIVAKRVGISFEVEVAGPGTAGDVPEYDAVVEGCGFASTNGASDHSFDLVSSAFTSVWLEANRAGTQHIGSYGRGNMTLNYQSKDIPFFGFQYTCKYNAPTAVALPTYTTSGFQTPEAVSNANTVTATLHGTSLIMESLTIDMQNQIEHIDRVGSETIELVNRDIVGTLVVEAPALGTKDWFAAAIARTQGVLTIDHGDTSGNIVELDCPLVEITNIDYTESQGTLMLEMGLKFIPSAGNDELVLVSK